jgi:hypothetical protein
VKKRITYYPIDDLTIRRVATDYAKFPNSPTVRMAYERLREAESALPLSPQGIFVFGDERLLDQLEM